MWEGIAGAIQEGVYNNLSMLYNDLSAQRSNRWQKQLMDIQFRNQKSLDKYGSELQYEMWEKTNYPAQVAMLKEAGLNPALLYGKGGPGGVTGSQTGGSATGGSAPQTQSPHFMSISASLAQGAQIELMKAEANKANAEAENLRGVVREEAKTRISKLITETTNEELKGKLISLQTDMTEIDKSYRPHVLEAEIANVLERTNQLKINNDLTEAQFNDLVKETHERSIGQVLNNILTKAETELKGDQRDLIKAQKQQIITSLTQKWTELGLHGRELDQKDAQIAITAFEAEMKANYPGAWNSLGYLLKGGITSLMNIERKFRGFPLSPIYETVQK